MKYDMFHSYNFDVKADKKALTESYNTKEQWTLVNSKEVPDSGGFLTDYCWYTDGEIHVFMFGDSDLYEPDVDYADHVCDDEKSAEDWFANYAGFSDGMSLDEELMTESLNGFPEWLKLTLKNNNVKRSLTNRGIDLQNATYVKSIPPRSNRDPILKDENKLLVYRLCDGSNYFKLYIPNVICPDVYNHEGRCVNCSDLSLVQLFGMLVEFGYIDLADAANRNVDKREERRKLAAATPRDVVRQPERGQQWSDLYNEYHTSRGYDKSGYPIDPQKYQKLLDACGLDTYSKKLEILGKKINETHKAVVTAMQKFDVLADGNADHLLSILDDAFSEVISGVRSYNRCLSNIKEVVAAFEEGILDEELANKRIARLFQAYAPECRTCCKDAVRELSHVAGLFPEVKAEAEDAADAVQDIEI